MKTLTDVKKTHATVMRLAEAHLELLCLVKTESADALRSRIRRGIDHSQAVLGDASGFKSRVALLKATARAANSDLKLFVGGTYAVIHATDPALFARLPRRETWAEMVPTEQAAHLLKSLLAAGSSAQRNAEQLEAVAQRRQRATKAWLDAGNAPLAAHRARCAVAELRLLVAEADVALYRLALPGSEMEGLLRKARGRER